MSTDDFIVVNGKFLSPETYNQDGTKKNDNRNSNQDDEYDDTVNAARRSGLTEDDCAKNAKEYRRLAGQIKNPNSREKKQLEQKALESERKADKLREAARNSEPSENEIRRRQASEDFLHKQRGETKGSDGVWRSSDDWV